jgi:hypothetical protein
LVRQRVLSTETLYRIRRNMLGVVFMATLSSCLYRASMTIKTLYYPTDAQIYRRCQKNLYTIT